MPGQYGTYDPTTNTGALDQGFLDSQIGKDYLRTHPEDAWDIYTGQKYGGTQGFSDNFREFMDTQRNRFLATSKLRTDVGNYGATGWGGYAQGESPLDFLNTKGYGEAITPESTQRLLTGLSRIAESTNNPSAAAARGYIEDPNNATNLWNLMGWASPTGSLIAPWMQRLGYENRPGRPLGGGTFLDYLANAYGTRRY